MEQKFREQSKEEKITKFGSIWVALTYDCNNRCRWCYASSNLQQYRQREMDSLGEEGVIKLLSGLDTRDVKLLGGEPTLYKNIVNFVRRLSDVGFKITFVTNGRKFSDYQFAQSLKDAGLTYISFSIEGHDSKTHDRETCVRGSFEELMRGIENAIKLDLEVATNTTVTPDNADSLEKIVDLVADKSKIISFNICEPWLREGANTSCVISPSEGAKIFERVYSYARSRGLKIKLTTPTPLCNFDRELLKQMKEDEAVGGICSILAGQNFVIDYNGDILPCTLFSGYPLFNIFDGDKCMNAEQFIESYNNERGKLLRESLRRFPSSKCNDDHEEFCTGGCPLFWLQFDPEKEVKGVQK